VRTLVIGDIHGNAVALDALLGAIGPLADDQFIFLGDYVDKGPDPKGVIERLIAFSANHRAVFLRGNHDQLMLDARNDPAKIATWESLAGKSPLASYSQDELQKGLETVPPGHWHFLESTCRDYFEDSRFIFVHGGIRPEMEPSLEMVERLHWTTLRDAAPHKSGRIVICGHSAQKTGKIADFGHTICIDTAITRGGWLTCLNVETFEFWQANAQGECQIGRLRTESSPAPQF
jgi:serine/threonine protein phosphatase 1